MDLANFADEVLDVVAGICGDAIVETHAKAAHVLDALCKRPGTSQRELAAIFGLSSEQLARSRELERARTDGTEHNLKEKDPVWASMCASDAVYTWNVIMERINQAAHWREEFRDLAGADEESDEEPCEDADIAASDAASVSEDDAGSAQEASARTRARARALIVRHLEPAPQALRRRLALRLDDDMIERCPGEKEYRHLARSIVANLRRNPMLAAGYATGRVPPQWMVLADTEALAPRLRQFQRRCFRTEAFNEAQQDVDIADLKRKMWDVAKGKDLQNPAQFEDPVD